MHKLIGVPRTFGRDCRYLLEVSHVRYLYPIRIKVVSILRLRNVGIQEQFKNIAKLTFHQDLELFCILVIMLLLS